MGREKFAVILICIAVNTKERVCLLLYRTSCISYWRVCMDPSNPRAQKVVPIQYIFLRLLNEHLCKTRLTATNTTTGTFPGTQVDRLPQLGVQIVFVICARLSTRLVDPLTVLQV